MHPYIQTILTAMTPIGELRLAIPVALTKLGLTIPEAYILSVIGNLIPVIVLLLFFERVSEYLKQRYSIFERLFMWLLDRTHRRIHHHYEIYGQIALVIFVSIPLPASGAWTGSVAAYLLGIPFWRALGLIAVGVMISGVIVSLASVGIISIF